MNQNEQQNGGEPLPSLLPVILWLEAGCDPKHAATELRMYEEKRAASPLPQEPREAELTDDEIIGLWHQHRPIDDAPEAVAFARALERELRGAQEVKAGEDARDAARYRWLRDRSNEAPDNTPTVYDSRVVASRMLASRIIYGDGLDAAIDAAMSPHPQCR